MGRSNARFGSGVNSRGFGGASRSSGARNAIADGQWHSFGGARGSASTGASSGARNSAIAGGGWHSFGAAGGSNRLGMANSGFGRGGFGRGFGNRGFGGFGFRGRGFGGCWGCGFGFGFGSGWGFGWGWPYWGLGWWGPSWDWGSPYPYPTDPDWYAPLPYTNGPNDYPGNDYGYNSVYPPPGYLDENSQPASDDPYAQGPSDLGPTTGNVAESTPTVLLYFRDGTMSLATDYWLSSDNKLHYVVSYSGESAIGMDQLDMQRTIDENAKRGVRFTLRGKTNRSNSAPAATQAPVPVAAPRMQPVSQS
jgi:hypothetical protein